MKKAFTLAEVLITLAIIGVVAAMTIPTLISSYNKKVVETKLLRVYSVMNNAIKMSTIDNGETVNWETLDNNSTYDDVLEWYNKYLGPYLKVSKVAQRNERGDILMYFPDGSVLAMEHDGKDMPYFINKTALENYQNGTSCFWFRFNPQKPATDTPSYKYITNSGFNTYAFAWDGTYDGAKHSQINSGFGCYDERGMLCAKLIQLNGWKIPEDYPYKF